MSTASMDSAPIHLDIPPIMIPIPTFHYEKSSIPVVTAQPQEQKVYHKNYVQYDFPSPILMYSTCYMCDISFEFASTRDNNICVSCEMIHNNYRWYGISLPKCCICETDCYYIHRPCNRSICRHCKYNFYACPCCKYPI